VPEINCLIIYLTPAWKIALWLLLLVLKFKRMSHQKQQGLVNSREETGTDFRQ